MLCSIGPRGREGNALFLKEEGRGGGEGGSRAGRGRKEIIKGWGRGGCSLPPSLLPFHLYRMV